MASDPWVGLDLDGSVAHYSIWQGIEHIGDPIPSVIDLTRKLLRQGKTVKIFTARMAEPDPIKRNMVRHYIREWCVKHIGVALEATNIKDFNMVALIDDRAIAVEKNTGRILGGDLTLLE